MGNRPTSERLKSQKDMSSMVSNANMFPMKRRGFTLIELLTVIVIIAILAAIIYPVFSSVTENNRQATSISNLHDISTKLAEFELDKHAAPPVLFGYADGSNSMDTVLANTSAADLPKRFPGLYPAYINNVNEFIDPNNTAKLTDTYAPDANVLCPSTLATTCTPGANDLAQIAMDPVTGAAGNPTLYVADSYDMSPQIAGSNTLVANPVVYVTRYQPAWTTVVTGGTVTSNASWTVIPASDSAQAIYERQIHWQFPPSNTYITSTTYHVPKSNVVLALYQDGSVKKLTTEQFTSRDGGTDPSSIKVNGNQVAGANFWQILPNGQ